MPTKFGSNYRQTTHFAWFACRTNAYYKYQPKTGSHVCKLETLEKNTSRRGPEIMMRLYMASDSRFTVCSPSSHKIVLILRTANSGTASSGSIIRRWNEKIKNPIKSIDDRTPNKL